MYAAARVLDNAPPKKDTLSQLNVIFPILCLLFVAFSLAATIVLALIPLYLPHKDITLFIPTYLVLIEYDGSLGMDGNLDVLARDAFAHQVEKGLKIKEGSFVMKTGKVVTIPNARKRRVPLLFRRRQRRGIRESVGEQKIYAECQFITKFCGRLCSNPGFVRRLKPLITTVTFDYNGKTCTRNVKVIFNPEPNLTVPPIYNPTSIRTPTDTMSTSTPATATIDLLP